MPDKPRPLTKAEWEAFRDSATAVDGFEGEARRLVATLDALFRYRERTRGFVISTLAASYYTNDIAAEEGIK